MIFKIYSLRFFNFIVMFVSDANAVEDERHRKIIKVKQMIIILKRNHRIHENKKWRRVNQKFGRLIPPWFGSDEIITKLIIIILMTPKSAVSAKECDDDMNGNIWSPWRRERKKSETKKYYHRNPKRTNWATEMVFYLNELQQREYSRGQQKKIWKIFTETIHSYANQGKEKNE